MSFIKNLLADPNIRRAAVALVFAVAGYIAGVIGGAPPTP